MIAMVGEGDVERDQFSPTSFFPMEHPDSFLARPSLNDVTLL